MKKILLVIVIIMFSLSQLNAQDAVFVKGDKGLNVGIGLGSTLYSGSYYKGQVPPVSASFEVAIKDGILEKGVLGVGGYLGYASYKYEYMGWGWKYTNIIIGPRGNFHYPLLNKLDTYTGLMLGYNISSAKEFGTITGYDYSASSGGIVWAWFAGARYYFSESFGLMAELGYGISYLNLGITLKL